MRLSRKLRIPRLTKTLKLTLESSILLEKFRWSSKTFWDTIGTDGSLAAAGIIQDVDLSILCSKNE
jgi:hypothetical protein